MTIIQYNVHNGHIIYLFYIYRGCIMGKICSGFGNSDTSEGLMPKLVQALEYAISEGCDTFYLGKMGNFDSMMKRATGELKKKYPHIERILVIPYITKSLEQNKRDYEREYDFILLPHEIVPVPPKYAIIRKNEWVIDNSDIVIACALNPYRGAGKAVDYAKRKGKHMINISPDRSQCPETDK